MRGCGFALLFLAAAGRGARGAGCPLVYEDGRYPTVHVDCSNASQEEDECVVTVPADQGQCSGRVWCENGEYRSTLACKCSDVDLTREGVKIRCWQIEVGETCEVFPDEGFSCTGVCRCNETLEFKNFVTCELPGCNTGSPQTLGGLDSVAVRCPERLAPGESCELDYDETQISCSGSLSCINNALFNSVKCECVDRCSPSLCLGAGECEWNPKTPSGPEDDACPVGDLFNCACDPCADHSCGAAERCVPVSKDTCPSGPECCEVASCEPIPLDGCTRVGRRWLWANMLVVVDCTSAAHPGDICELSYNATLLTCEGTVFCAEYDQLIDNVTCFCNYHCDLDACVSSSVVPSAPQLTEATACPVENECTCRCGACAKDCPRGNACGFVAKAGCDDAYRCCEEPACLPFGCPDGGPVVDLWKNGLVLINCSDAKDNGEECKLVYDTSLIECTGTQYCATHNQFVGDVQCQCARPVPDPCSVATCSEGEQCVPLFITPSDPTLTSQNACPAVFYNCTCDPCALHWCPAGSYCTGTVNTTAPVGSCNLTPVCEDLCLSIETPLHIARPSCMDAPKCLRGLHRMQSIRHGDSCKATGSARRGKCLWGMCHFGAIILKGERWQNELCAGMVCRDKCEFPVRTGRDCVVVDGADVADVGVCHNDGLCIMRPVNDDDCVRYDCGQGRTCFDVDMRRNGRGIDCACPLGTRWTGNVCALTGADECPIPAKQYCASRYQDCTRYVKLDVMCFPRVCEPLSTMRARLCDKLPPSCSFVKDPAVGYDGCPSNPCAYACTEACASDGVTMCREAARAAVSKARLGSATALLHCVLTGTSALNQSTACIELPCPAPRCPRPAPGCVFVPARDASGRTLRTDTGCPAFPCGREECWNDCSPQQTAACLSMTPRHDCSMSQPGLCRPFRCPIVACSNPLPGCRYDPQPEPVLVDVVGCPLSPCGILNCTHVSKCTAAKQWACGINGQVCVVVGRTPRCVDRQCSSDQRSCVSSPGCRFDTSRATGPDGCPVYPCGKEICEPTLLCASTYCPQSCIVFEGKPVCVADGLQPCSGGSCPGEMQCVASPRGPLCELHTACDEAHCPTGTYCEDSSPHGAIACVDASVVNCMPACDDDEKCVAKWAGKGRNPWHCVVMPADGCAQDHCTCAGLPCGAWEVCVVDEAGWFHCVSEKSSAGFAAAQADACAPFVCHAGMLCTIRHGKAQCAYGHLAGESAVRIAARQACSCQPGEMCNTATARCELPVCFGCSSNCTWLNGRAACGVTDRCSSWKWPPTEGTCVEDSDCEEGYVCPHVQAPPSVGAVSSWCSCDERTGKPSRCSNSVLRSVRYCVPRIWACDDVPMAVTNLARNTWCCAVMQRLCVEPVQGIPSYSCFASPDASGGPETWPTARLSFCCSAGHPQACDVLAVGSSPPGLPFDCSSRELWPADKAAWCCENAGVNCPVPSYSNGTRVAGGCSTHPSAWSDAHLEYCCRELRRGCQWLRARGLSDIYDCSTRELWSVPKKRYCCERYGKGCQDKQGYNCMATNGSEVALWGDEQREFCCAEFAFGCVRDDDQLGVGPYRCSGDLGAAASSGRRKWCCAKRNIGCLQQFQQKKLAGCSQSTADKVQRKLCCRRVGHPCDFRCPYDNATRMTDEQRSFCCETKGVGCKLEPTDFDFNYAALPDNLKPTDSFYSYELRLWLDWDEVIQNPIRFVETTLVAISSAIAAEEGPVDLHAFDAFDALAFTVALHEVVPLEAAESSAENPSTPDVKAQAFVPPAAWQGETRGLLRDMLSVVSPSDFYVEPNPILFHYTMYEEPKAISTVVRLRFSVMSSKSRDFTPVLQEAVQQAKRSRGILAQTLEGFGRVLVPSVNLKTLAGQQGVQPPAAAPTPSFEPPSALMLTLAGLGAACAAAVAVVVATSCGGSGKLAASPQSSGAARSYQSLITEESKRTVVVEEGEPANDIEMDRSYQSIVTEQSNATVIVEEGEL
ncbi:G-protein coupled receptor [Diplonema papillatum]|nr:G-protein coupled receptor [Diplonema papillatum]